MDKLKEKKAKKPFEILMNSFFLLHPVMNSLLPGRCMGKQKKGEEEIELAFFWAKQRE